MISYTQYNREWEEYGHYESAVARRDYFLCLYVNILKKINEENSWHAAIGTNIGYKSLNFKKEITRTSAVLNISTRISVIYTTKFSDKCFLGFHEVFMFILIACHPFVHELVVGKL